MISGEGTTEEGTAVEGTTEEGTRIRSFLYVIFVEELSREFTGFLFLVVVVDAIFFCEYMFDYF